MGGEIRLREEIWRETARVWGHLRDDMETWCSGNPPKKYEGHPKRGLLIMAVIESPLLAISCHQIRLPVLRMAFIPLSCWPRKSHENPQITPGLLRQ